MIVLGLFFGLLVILPLYLLWVSAVRLLGHVITNPLTYVGAALMVPTAILAAVALVQGARIVVWAIRSRKAAGDGRTGQGASPRPSMSVLVICSISAVAVGALSAGIIGLALGTSILMTAVGA